MSNLNKFLQSFSNEVEKKQKEEKAEEIKNKPKITESIDVLMNYEHSDENEISNTSKIKNTKNDENDNLFNNRDVINKNKELNKEIIKEPIKETAKPKTGTLKLKIKGEKQINKLKLNQKKNIQSSEVKVEHKLSKEEEIFLENRRRETLVKQQLEEDLKRAKEEEEKELELSHSNIKKSNLSKTKSSMDEKALAEKLFEESETPLVFKEKWFALYEKALSSGKQTMTNQKVKNGKFRLNETGALEILPDFETKGKSSNDLLHEVWKIN